MPEEAGVGDDDRPEFISIPEWARRVHCSADAAYRAARSGDVPGLFRIGRLMRVNWNAFVAATAGEPSTRRGP